MVTYSLGQIPPLPVLTESVKTTVSDIQLLVLGETGGWHSGLSRQVMAYACSGLSLL